MAALVLILFLHKGRPRGISFAVGGPRLLASRCKRSVLFHNAHKPLQYLADGTSRLPLSFESQPWNRSEEKALHEAMSRAVGPMGVFPQPFEFISLIQPVVSPREAVGERRHLIGPTVAWPPPAVQPEVVVKEASSCASRMKSVSRTVLQLSFKLLQHPR